MRKYINKIALLLLVVLLYTDVNQIYATTRGLYFNTTNQANSESEYMAIVPGNYSYPIEYFALTGDTSRGEIKFEIYEYSDATSSASKNLLHSENCEVGNRIATTGVTGGTRAPLIASGGKNFAKIFLSKGALYSPNSGYSYYIGNTFMSTPVEDVMRCSLNAEVDLDAFRAELNAQVEQVEQIISEWDEANAQRK